MLERIENRLLTLAFAMFLAIYWSLNALDKFYAGKTFFGLKWYGSDHAATFGDRFVHVGLRLDSLENAIMLVGVWQFAVSIPFLLTVVLILAGSSSRDSATSPLYLGLVLSLFTLIAYCAFDIVSGNEQGVMMNALFALIVAATYGVARVENVVGAEKTEPTIHGEPRTVNNATLTLQNPMAIPASALPETKSPSDPSLVEPVRTSRWFDIAPWHNWDGRRRVFR